jgi:CBS-domain-containing membrane protein
LRLNQSLHPASVRVALSAAMSPEVVRGSGSMITPRVERQVQYRREKDSHG